METKVSKAVFLADENMGISCIIIVFAISSKKQLLKPGCMLFGTEFAMLKGLLWVGYCC